MKANIVMNRAGNPVLVITPESTTEEYAIASWQDVAYVRSPGKTPMIEGTNFGVCSSHDLSNLRSFVNTTAFLPR